MENVSVIIVTFNECRNVQPCIKSFFAADSRINEIVVIDDHSTDSTKQKVRSLNDPRIHFYQKNHNKYYRGKSDSIYMGAHLCSNDNVIIADCDTIACDLTDCIDKLDSGYDLVGIRIGIIENGTLLSKCEKLEYDISMNHTKPWIMDKFGILMNVSGAGFGIKRKHLIGNKIPSHIMGEDLTYSLLAPINGWKYCISTSTIDTYCIKDLKSLFIQRNRWVYGYYQIINHTKYYWRLADSIGIYYRTLAVMFGVSTLSVVTGHWLIWTLLVLFIYFLNDYRFIKDVRMTLIMMVYRQINFITSLTFPKYGKVWKVIR